MGERDTLVISTKGQERVIRLVGIELPEQGQAYSSMAREALAAKVLGNQRLVTLQVLRKDSQEGDFALVWIDGRCVNADLLREGWAWYRRDTSDPAGFAPAEEEARKNKAGIWVQDNPTPPWEWRKTQPKPAEAGAKLDGRGALEKSPN